MGNKDNMRQAMKELLGLVGIGEETPSAAKVEQEPEAAPVAAPKVEREAAIPRAEQQRPVQPEPVRVERPVERPVVEQPRVTEQPRVERPVEPEPVRVERPVEQPKRESIFSTSFIHKVLDEPVEEPSVADDPFFRQEPVVPAAPSADTVISAGTALFGDLRADGDVDVRGTLKGNLQATGRVRIFGKVLGDVKGASVELISCAVQGNITAADSVTLDQGTVLIGDVIASELTTDGKMKGTAMIDGAANFHSKAVLAGNVTASLVSMSEGARIQGTVRISQDEKTDALFDAALNI